MLDINCHAMWISNEMVGVQLSGKMVVGLLDGNDMAWSFSSSDREFLSLFPTGEVSSFSTLGDGILLSVQKNIQQQIDRKIADLIMEQTVSGWSIMPG